MQSNHNTNLAVIQDFPIFLANGHDVVVLAENLRIHPDVLVGTGNGIFISGVQGTGKTGILARILEQASQFLLPMVVFDREGDLAPAVSLFPRGVIGTYKNCPTAKDIIKEGLQVVYDLSSWPTMDEKGLFIATMVNALYRVVDALAVSQRTPCLIALDEAALFLPQRRGETFSLDTYKAMHDAFHNVATTGRKRGLTPVLASQKLSEVAKTVLSPGTYIMLRQTVHTDLKRYLDYIEREDIFSYMTERQICQFVASLQSGRAIVKLASGEQRICQFYERESVHTSHTPQTQAAHNLYSALPFHAEKRFGCYMPDEGLHVSAEKPLRPVSPLPVQHNPITDAERVREMLANDPTLTITAIVKQTGFSMSNVARVRKKFFAKK